MRGGSTRRKHQNSKVLPLFWQGLEGGRNSTRTAALSSPPRSSKSHPPSSAPFYTACPTFSLLSFPLPISLLRLPYFKARKKIPLHGGAGNQTLSSSSSMHVSGPLCIQQSAAAASPLFLSPISRGISWGVLGAPPLPLPPPVLATHSDETTGVFSSGIKEGEERASPLAAPWGRRRLLNGPYKKGGGEGQNLPLSELPVLLRRGRERDC